MSSTQEFEIYEIIVEKYAISVRRVSKKFGFREVSEDDDWNLFWTDYSVALERVMEMKRYQVNKIVRCFLVFKKYLIT